MNETKKLIQQITEGIQDKKGKKIVIADLTKIDDTICNYFVICQGNSPSQVTAIVESIRDADKSEEIGIAHADDAAGAQFLLDALRQRGFTGECLTVCYEPVTGSHVGPGTVALFFQGIHR